MFLSRAHPRPFLSASPFTVLTIGAASLGSIFLIRAVSNFSRSLLSTPPSQSKKWIDSPLKFLSAAELSRAAYPPDAIPGAKDIDTPYGSIRCYEWGPENGERVLMIHGISTPSCAFGNLGEQLVRRGCRVMLFDLFGRGYSDAPLRVDYDERLYTSQILFCLASSPMPWPKFHLVGYSLGGCLAVNFALHSPSRVKSIIAITPGGLLRYSKMSWRTRTFYSPFVQTVIPESFRNWFVRTRLFSNPEKEATVKPPLEIVQTEDSGPNDNVEEQLQDSSPKYRRWTATDCNNAVNESLEHHEGLPIAFISSLQYCPIYEQDEKWKALQCKILMLLGKTDPIIKVSEIPPIFESILPEPQRKVVVIDAGHELPITKSEECASAIADFWKDL